MGKTVVIGPPGTGKTTYLMDEIDKLLRIGMQPADIAFVSFSKAAVGEALQRVALRTGRAESEFKNFRTLHSLFYAAVGFRGFKFMERVDERVFYATAGYGASLEEQPVVLNEEHGTAQGAAAVNVEATDDMASIYDPQRGDKLMTAWEYSRQRMCDLGEAIREKGIQCSVQELELFGERYSKFKVAAAKVDFTDVLEKALRLKIRCRAPVLIVDEAQDLSPLQIALISLSIESTDEVWIAGDDDQAIYAFQGASPQWLISLWDKAKWQQTLLNVSHRCPEHVRLMGTAIAERCSERIPKEYKTKHNRGSTRNCFWPETEAAIANLGDGERAFVLARTNAFCAALCVRLYDSGIVYHAERSGGGPNPLGQESLINAAKTLYSLSVGNPVESADLVRVIQRHVSSTYYQRGALERLREYDGTTVRQNELAAIGFGPLVHTIANDVWAPLEAKARKRRDKRSDVDWLRKVWRDNGNDLPKPKAIVMTYHASKGREAELIVIDPSINGLIKSSLQDGGLKADPEHRAAYVAVTRSKRDVIFVHGVQHFHKGRYEFV